MPKFYGAVGYFSTVEVTQGVWTDEITERFYHGDILKLNKRQIPSTDVNDEISINSVFSIVADPFAYENFAYIKYVKYMGFLWKVTGIEIQRPRIIITIGGRYNGK